jgi:hypothetical protein
MTPTCDLSVIIVSWNVSDLLADCLQSLATVSRPRPDQADLRAFGPADAPRTVEVIVVDNASSDGTPERVAAQFPWVRLLRAPDNLGFTRGNNLGYGLSRGRFIYFLNPDTEIDPGFPEPAPGAAPADSLWQLYAAAEQDGRAAVVGPQLRYGDGALQPSYRRFPTPLTGFFESTWLGRAWPGNPWARRLHMAGWSVPYPHDVDWVVGAAMLCRREALEVTRMPAGPFDEQFFMYSEELDLCRRLKPAGWRVVYVPQAVVVHHEARSSDQVATQLHIQFNRIKVRYYAKWFGPRWAEGLRRYLLLEFRVQLWEERLKGLLGHKRELRRQRVAAYREVIRSGLN